MEPIEADKFVTAPDGLPSESYVALNETTAPRQRRSFPLWSKCAGAAVLLLVAFSIGWTRYQFEWIRARHEFLADAEIDVRRKLVTVHKGDEPHDKNKPRLPPVMAPWFLRLFGEAGVREILAEDGSWAVGREWRADPKWIERGRELFPEARVEIRKIPHGGGGMF